MISRIMGLLGVVCAWVLLALTTLSVRDFGMHWSALIFAFVLVVLISCLFIKSERGIR